MRSEIAVKWLQDYGVNVEKLVGGYKNFRSWIVSQHLNIDKYKKKMDYYWRFNRIWENGIFKFI